MLSFSLDDLLGVFIFFYIINKPRSSVFHITIERKDNRYHLVKDIQHLSIPTTIHDVIMARVDSLPERAKEILQTGSVIERELCPLC